MKSLINKHLQSLALVLLFFTGTTLSMNFSDLHEIFFKMDFKDRDVQFNFLAEYGVHSSYFDECSSIKSALGIWGKHQNALAMLKGFGNNCPATQLNNMFSQTASDTRGIFTVDGKLTLNYNIEFALRGRFYNYFIFGAYLPVRSMSLTNVCWKDLTPDTTLQDALVKELLTDHIKTIAHDLGCLDLCGWHRSGLGDMILLLEWIRSFPQTKPYLRNIQLQARFGPSLPTGLKTDQNKLLALPLGNDGSVGLIFGVDLEAYLGRFMSLGFDVELTHFFGHTQKRRIKVDRDQTDLLLLQKACVYREPGLRQEFNLFLKANDIGKGFSLDLDYQYFKQGDTHLALFGNKFSSVIANSAQSLESYTAHTLMFSLTENFKHLASENPRIVPQLRLYAKAPVNGKNSIQFTTVGAILAIEF